MSMSSTAGSGNADKGKHDRDGHKGDGHNGDGHNGDKHNGWSLAMAMGALGVVFGDIGTSPLYAFRESLSEESGLDVTAGSVLGVLSLITWALILTVTVKYIIFVLRADHEGEGGILALTALVPREGDHHGKGFKRALILLGIFGTALLYGDGVITPAITVLSALEGIELVAPAAEAFVVPGAVVVLVLVFLAQRWGTAGIGAVFGPIMLVWFSVIGLLGLLSIIQEPAVLAAVSPLHAVQFFANNGFTGYLVLGSVILVVTGGEALYADLGHFGISPIRHAWFAVVLPGLLLNYYGQGALLLSRPDAIENPFFRLAPEWATIPMVVLATAATVIASQALISGAFSLTMQGVQMGYLPRMRIIHTSEEERGQIYIPSVNTILMIACILLVLTFQSSSALAAAYGVAVSATMAVTTILFAVVALERFGWNPALLGIGILFFLIIDFAFLGANLLKIPDGGWIPLVIAAAVMLLMTTWRHGRRLLNQRMGKGRLPIATFLDNSRKKPPSRVKGTAIYLTTTAGFMPVTLLTNLRHNNALHEQVVLVHVKFSSRPRIPSARRATVTKHEQGFVEVNLHYGYRDTTDIPRALELRVAGPHDVDLGDVTYLIGRERVLATDRPGMARWREQMFAFMTRNSPDITEIFNLPRDRTIEIGRLVEI